MKIAVIHNLTSGGARRRLQNQIEHLHGGLLEFCLSSATPITAEAVQVPFSRRAETLPPALRPAYRYADQLALEAAWRRLATAVNGWNPSVLYINPCRFLQTPPLPYNSLAPALYFCDEPRRVDYEAAAASARNPRTLALYRPLYRHERTLDRRSATAVAKLATNSHYTATAITAAYGRQASIIHPGVSPALVASHPVVVCDYVLSVGTLLPSKGHALAIAAAARARRRPPVQIVAPRPAPDYERELRGLAAELGVELTLQIGVDDAALANLYASAAVTVYLAHREPFGMASIEAQANGCPVLVADDGGLPETIDAGVTGFVCAPDPEPAARLLDRMLDPGWRAGATLACRTHAERFSWRFNAERLTALLEQTASSARTPNG